MSRLARISSLKVIGVFHVVNTTRILGNLSLELDGCRHIPELETTSYHLGDLRPKRSR